MSPAAQSDAAVHLSQREHDILELLADYRSDREIAVQLVLAYSTVKWYNRQIFNKLGVNNRQQAVERAIGLGLLHTPQPPLISGNNLPEPLTPLVGRVKEVEELTRLLNQPHTRLITILAPGGMGKTRLALAAVQSVLGRFPNGVHFVPLVGLTSADHLVTAIANAIGFPFAPDRRMPKEQLIGYFRTKQTLLVLDNFEHLLDGATLISDLLSAASGLKVLVTSRERLKLDGEVVYMIEGLSYPAQASEDNPIDYDSIRLFLERAQRVNSRPSPSSVADIVRICQLVGGMPLAVELAAAWCSILSPAEIAQEITRSADFLSTSMRNVPERLQSIRTVFEATWQRLGDHERQAFRRLSVFHGGFTREAAEVVTGADLRILAGLVDKALLWHQPERARYSVHELLRQYAAEQLALAGETMSVIDAHRDYFGHLACDLSAAFKTPQHLKAIDAFDADYDNIREAFLHAIETGLPEIINPFISLSTFSDFCERSMESGELYGAAIEKLGDQESIVLGKLLSAQAGVMYARFKLDEARSCAEKSIAMLRRLGAQREMIGALSKLGTSVGYVFSDTVDLDRQSALLNEALEIARQYDDQYEIMEVTLYLGWAAFNEVRSEEARLFLSQAHSLALKLGNVVMLSFVCQIFGHLEAREGNYAQARQLLYNSLANARKARIISTQTGAFEVLRVIALAEGDLPEARRFAEQAVKLQRELGRTNDLFFVLLGLSAVALAENSLEEFIELLREMIQIFESFDDHFFVYFLSYVVAQYLARVGSAPDALLLWSYFVHHPGYRFTFPNDREEVEAAVTELRAELSPEISNAMWERGRTLTVDDVLAKLRTLI